MDAVACPYCGVDLKKMPLRKTKCKSCQNVIYPRVTPNSQLKRLFTEHDLPGLENDWGRYHEAKRVERLVNQDKICFGLPEKMDFGAFLLALKRIAEEGPLSLAETILRHGIPARAPASVESSGFYFTHAQMVSTESGCHSLRKLASWTLMVNYAATDDERYSWGLLHHRLTLEGIADLGGMPKIKGMLDECTSCQQIAAKEWSIAEALAEMPLPNRSCIRWPYAPGGCAFWGIESRNSKRGSP